METSIKSWLDAAVGFFYPPVCQICQAEPAGPREGYVGFECRRRVYWIEAPFCARCGLPYAGRMAGGFQCGNCRGVALAFRWARAAVVAKGVVLEAIHRYKYDRALWLEPFLAGLLVRAARDETDAEDWDMIVPVPLHGMKAQEREFNQSERLARYLGRATGVAVCNRLLRRVRPTDTQTHLSRAERAANVAGAFALRTSGGEGKVLRGCRILLVDDVLTTGATVSACASVLRAAGAVDVCVWTVARGV